MVLRVLYTLALVACVQTAHADTIQLKNGDELNARIIEVTATTVVIDHPQLGLIRLDRNKIEGDLDHELNPGLFGSGFLSGWNRSINLGLNGSQGSSIGTNFTGGLNLNYKDKDKRWLISGQYFFQRSDDGVTANNAQADLRRDWLLPNYRWFAFGALRYQFDAFQSWKHRVIVSAGPGYNLLDREKQTLDVRFGPAYTRDFGGDSNNKIEILTALDYTWQPRNRIKITLSNQFYTETWPDAGQFRNLTSAEWTTNILKEPELNLILGVNNEYESDLEPPSKKNNLKYYSTLGLDF